LIPGGTGYSFLFNIKVRLFVAFLLLMSRNFGCLAIGDGKDILIGWKCLFALRI